MFGSAAPEERPLAHLLDEVAREVAPVSAWPS